MELDTAYAGLIGSAERCSMVLELAGLQRALALELPKLEIGNAAIMRYADQEQRMLESIFCLRDGHPYQPPAQRFRATELYPPGAVSRLRRQTTFVLPLTAEHESLGVAVLEFGPRIAVHQILREQISTALRQCRLHAELIRKTLLHERSVEERQATAERMQSLSVLAGGIAHDLNNALGPLVALPDVILEELDELEACRPPHAVEVRRDLLTVKAASSRAAQTIQDLLTLGRQGQTKKQSLDLNRVVATCWEAERVCRVDSGDPPITVTLELHTAPLLVRGSEPHLARAVSNLIRNAIEAIAGTGRVVVRTDRVCLTEPASGYEVIAPGDYVVVAVSDTGRGIASHEIHRVFEPFFSKKRHRSTTSSGLGLAIVYGVVKEHEGFVDVRSALDRGTTFMLFFHRAGEPVPEQRESVLPRRGSASVLVVDEDPIQLRTAHRVLSRLGHVVTSLGSGAKASELFSQAHEAADPSPFDLVIVDLGLRGGEDGRSLLARVRQLFPLQPGIITGDATGRPESTGEGLHWLEKPYTLDALASAVKAALGSGPSTRPPAKRGGRR
jgi:signal transduction histidine kinase/CheY-like chemotaxis protein